MIETLFNPKVIEQLLKAASELPDTELSSEGAYLSFADLRTGRYPTVVIMPIGILPPEMVDDTRRWASNKTIALLENPRVKRSFDCLNSNKEIYGGGIHFEGLGNLRLICSCSIFSELKDEAFALVLCAITENSIASDPSHLRDQVLNAGENICPTNPMVKSSSMPISN